MRGRRSVGGVEIVIELIAGIVGSLVDVVRSERLTERRLRLNRKVFCRRCRKRHRVLEDCA